MKILILVLFSILIISFKGESDLTYIVKKINKEINIDAKWDKAIWSDIDSIQLSNYMGSKPDHFPTVYVKMVYSDTDLFVIFKVMDRYVKSITEEYQGNVFEDSCVEFFFSPTNVPSKGYFNLETNCGGMQLFHFNSYNKKKKVLIKNEDYKNIVVAHSLSKINIPEIKDSVTWFIEYKIPFEVISKYFTNDNPKSQTIWRGNFYKCGDETSHPHWLTWNKVENPTPNFHLPQFFGTLIFE